jgi:hypothetical protein
MRPTLLVLALTACTGAEAAAPVVVPPGAPASLSFDQGTGQTGQVHQALPVAIGLKVLDAKDQAVPQQLVNWVIVKGGGSVFVGATLTNEQGESQNSWTLGDTAGIQSLEARVIDSTGAPVVIQRLDATATPGPLAVAHFAVHVVQIAEGGSVQLVTTGADSYGNTVTGPMPAALDTLGQLAGDRWTATGFGRARFEIPGDTMTVYARPNFKSLSAVYQQPVMGTVYVESAMMSWDSLSPAPGGNANDCGAVRLPSWDGWAAWGGVDFLATRADNADSVQFAYPYLYNAICVDLRSAEPTWWTYYFYPDDFEGPVHDHHWQLQLLEVSADSLILSSGSAVNDTLVIRR